MDELFLNLKISQYLSRAILESKKENAQAKRMAARNVVIFTRLKARKAVEELTQAREVAAAAERSWKKAKESGISFPLGERRIEQLKKDSAAASQRLADTGGEVMDALDFWQTCGATLQDLYNLCNRDYQKVTEEIGQDRLDRLFSEMIFVYNLDFKSRLDFLDYCVDAPLTHAIKEYMFQQILGTEKGRQVSREAFKECFPEIWDQRLNVYTDEDGVQHMVDKDGTEVGDAKDE